MFVETTPRGVVFFCPLPTTRATIPLRVVHTVHAAIGLGSNIGEREAHLAAAVAAISRLRNATLVSVSSIIETEPVGPVPQGRYLNAATRISTSLSPAELLRELLEVERSRGRDRTTEARWGPRTLDLDLLLYGDRTISEPGLVVPHPRLHERAFVLVPLAQVWPDARVPGQNRTVAELLAAISPPERLPSGQ